MLRFVVEVLIDAAILVVVLAFLSLISVQPSIATELQTFGHIGLVAFGVALIVSLWALFRALEAPEGDET